jgi:hypothetical protein
MKIFDYGRRLTTQEYEEIQIERSREKFHYCRVSILDMIQKMNIIKNNGYVDGPILCLGVRNGREINLLRIMKKKFFSKILFLFEIKRFGFSSLFPFLEKFFIKSNISKISSNGVYGVELNPDIDRSDVFSGSFDAMPLNYQDLFEVVYSNSFDQSIDPKLTAREWVRVVKDGGFIILDWVEGDIPNYTDPTGGISKSDMTSLFNGKVIFYSQRGNFDPEGNSSCIIIQINKGNNAH